MAKAYSKKLDKEERDALLDVVLDQYGGSRLFGKALEEATAELTGFSYNPKNTLKYLEGKLPVSVNIARAMLDVLGGDHRVSFLEKIANQKLVRER